jgi:uroporphyrinogen decarboxylase
VFQCDLQFDLVKVTPSADYMANAWGATTEYFGERLGVREYVNRPITEPEDWNQVQPLEPHVVPSLVRELEAIRTVKSHSPEIPVLATVFTPLSVARYLCGEDLFLAHSRLYRKHLEGAVDAIAATTVDFVRAVIEAGADGIYVSAYPASHSMISEVEYRDLASRSDVAVLEAAEDALLRILHFHLPYPMLQLAKQYPANLVSWEHTRGGPSLAHGKALTGKPVIGGIDQFGALSMGNADDVVADVRTAIADVGEKGLIFASSCSIPIHTPRSNLLRARDYVHSMGRLS